MSTMLQRKPIIERAFELAASGQFRIPSDVRKTLFKEGYTQSDVFTLEGRATWAQLRKLCLESRHAPPPKSEIGQLEHVLSDGVLATP
ncbi:hypothetical protein [Brevundimonas faecalis]|uniref:AbrB/MazE/SpoVT family DNA-binding domain-containing protein n=1 Tax=Brevundimonas faecalis TaxID=947378 RepID=A0ABV2R7W5_9CAUL